MNWWTDGKGGWEAASNGFRYSYNLAHAWQIAWKDGRFCEELNGGNETEIKAILESHAKAIRDLVVTK